MGIDFLDRGNLVGSRQQVLLNSELDLAADAKRGGEQQIERAADRALGRVLRRHHGELRGARLGAAERLVHRCARQRVDRAAEVLAHRLLAERAFGAEVGHADRFFQAAAGRDDLPEHRREALGREHTRAFRHPSQDLGLALRPVRRRAVLQAADLLRERRAALEQRGELVVDAVDLAAEPLDLVSHPPEDTAPRARRSVRRAPSAHRR